MEEITLFELATGLTCFLLGYTNLVNQLTKEQCENIMKDELSNWTEKQGNGSIRNNNGCIISSRNTGTVQYPVRQLSTSECPEAYKLQQKQFRKAFVHHLSFRAATGKIITQDIVHTCGQGKRKANDKSKTKGCINSDHLDMASHADNMRAVNCPSLVQCPDCLHIFSPCALTHTPICQPHGSLLDGYRKQKKK